MRVPVQRILRRFVPNLFHFQHYSRAAKKMGNYETERAKLFDKLISDSEGKRCLQIGARDRKYAPHWTSVDLHDMSDYIDYHYDIQDLKFSDESFDVVACNAVLEHVDDPQSAIGELRRVLRKNGLIWVEVPFNQPYHPCPNDHWRVSPTGLRIWMREFKEVACGHFRIDKSVLYNGVFFLGKKLL